MQAEGQAQAEAQALERALDREDLGEVAAEKLMLRVLTGGADPQWLAGYLVALRMKGESVGEITGFARAMRAQATPIQCVTEPLVDTCGTGGDSSGTFNISTTAAFVVAGAGGRVAKHGNRSVSSRCGSADVLESLGANLTLNAEQVGQCVDECGLGFLFAPALHGAMKHAIGPRRALGIRTVFNLLGPLTNPAGAPHQLIGVFDASWLEILGRVLHQLGSRRAILVHGSDGLDELTTTGPSTLLLMDEGEMDLVEVDPVQLGLRRAAPDELAGGDTLENAQILRAVLSGEKGAATDITRLNAGAALWACGLAGDLQEGLERATESIHAGGAQKVLEDFLNFGARFV